MSAYMIKMLEDKEARAFQAIVASLPLEQRADAKALTYKHIAPRPCNTCAGLGVTCHLSLRPQTTTTPAVPTKRMELAWDDGEDDYTGSQMWIFFVAGVCECCAVTSAFCSSANRVVAFSCLPRAGRTWTWCLVRDCLPYWPRALHEIGRKSLGAMPDLGWCEPHEALSEYWTASGRLRLVKAGEGEGRRGSGKP